MEAEARGLSGRSDVTTHGGAGYQSGDGSDEEEQALTGEILDKFSQLITTALGLVAALAWNEAIQQLFSQLFGEAGGALAAKFFYAVLVTLMVMLVVVRKRVGHLLAPRLPPYRPLLWCSLSI